MAYLPTQTLYIIRRTKRKTVDGQKLETSYLTNNGMGWGERPKSDLYSFHEAESIAASFNDEGKFGVIYTAEAVVMRQFCEKGDPIKPIK